MEASACESPSADGGAAAVRGGATVVAGDRECAGTNLGATVARDDRCYGDWGRDGVLAVATRHLGWRLAEAVREVADVGYAAAQGIRRFWQRAATEKELAVFVHRLKSELAKR
ncbi:MAG TPA: hypothetical protein PLX89_24945 [Verrucomicrobiota bacterium]|nr:hypothetical protein [Verrucomicrobiales bacterium]HRI16257.1 hypothetical protein [Verrucomicrobiota bacterium]